MYSNRTHSNSWGVGNTPEKKLDEKCEEMSFAADLLFFMSDLYYLSAFGSPVWPKNEITLTTQT